MNALFFSFCWWILILPVGSKHYQDLSGRYATSAISSTILTITVENGELYVQQNKRPKLKLTPLDSHRFSLEGLPVEITFMADASKTVDGFILTQNNQDRHYYRIEKLRAEYEAIAHTPRPNGASDAVLMKDMPALKALIKAGIDIMELDTRPRFAGPNGRRPLNWAALENNLPAIELLVKSGADINATNLSGFTPLHHAAEAGSLEAAQLLLQLGAKPDLKTKTQHTALEIAAKSDHRQLVALLANNPAN